MHHAFTGSARKPRQVNLSGRPSSNPWANLSGTASKPATGNAAVVHAQADRARRQHEREKLSASRKVQKTWRGHSSRRKRKAEWRHEWDEHEKARLHQNHLDFSRVLNPDLTLPPYASQKELDHQLSLLVHFQEYRRHIVRDTLDTLRILHFASTLRASEIDTKDPEVRLRLRKLGVHAARHIRSIRSIAPSPDSDRQLVQLASLVSYLSGIVPDDMVQSSPLYMEVLKGFCDRSSDTSLQQAGVTAISGLLSVSSPSVVVAYEAFIAQLMGDETLSLNPPILERLAWNTNHRILLRILQDTVRSTSSRSQIWQLAYVIWIERQAVEKASPAEKFEFIKALSALLGSCANEISDRLGVLDVPMNGNENDALFPLEPFIADNLKSISEEAAVREAISIVSNRESVNGLEQTTDFEATKRLADYAVSMLRAFSSNGDRARNIRKWLWQTTVKTSSGTIVSTLQYLWTSISSSDVFKTICKSHRNVLSALREAHPESNQIGRPAVTDEEIQHWRVEWRIILLFMELYSFVLKVIEDDEFFSGEQTIDGDTLSSASRSGRRALALQDAATLTTFLKNLAFVLYWNAAELVPTTEVEELGALTSLFGAPEPSSRFDVPKAVERPKIQTLTGNGVSHTYLKGLSTSLLRMLHERDSRRKFVPPDHWLMTSQVDMTGFISAVVDEEEKRHQLDEGEDDANDEPLEEDLNAPMSQSPRAMFAQLMSGTGGFNYSAASSRHGATERQRNQARKKRMIESLAPRLEILRNLPFFIPFETRVQIFREFIYKDQIRRRGGHVDPDIWRMSVARSTMGRDIDGRPPGHDVISRQHAEIRRESVFEDAYNSYYPLGERLKEPIQISFIDKFGAPEAGIDGGGVTKEFLTSVTSQALDPAGAVPMFAENTQHYLYPNPLLWQEQVESLRQMGVAEGSADWNDHLREFLRRYEFLGRVIGKCLYEGILIDVNFAGFFLLKWALTGGNTVATSESGYRASINDLREYDEELYQGLLKLKYYPGDVETDFGLNFTVNDTLHVVDPKGKELDVVKTVNLYPNGGNKVVDNLWRHIYIDRMVKYRLQDQPEKVTNAFLRGLGQIISPSWLAMFNQKELQKLVGGDNTELDITDLRRNTLYGGLYVIGDDGLEHPTVELFWKAMQEMDDADRRKVLKFVTSTPRAPLLGFSNLHPKFSIRDSSADQERLPSTSTCVNLLKLPRYGDLRTMKDKLLYAANAGAGFDLS